MQLVLVIAQLCLSFHRESKRIVKHNIMISYSHRIVRMEFQEFWVFHLIFRNHQKFFKHIRRSHEWSGVSRSRFKRNDNNDGGSGGGGSCPADV
jgi:hypothetical protein